MKKAIITILSLYLICCSTNINIARVSVSNDVIQARDTNNKPVTLYTGITPDNRTLLLEHVTPGKKYIVIIDNCDTFNTEDDLILFTLEI